MLTADYSEKTLVQLMVSQHNFSKSQAIFTANILKYMGYSNAQRYQIVMNHMGMIHSVQRVCNLWCFFIITLIILMCIAYSATILLYKIFFGWLWEINYCVNAWICVTEGHFQFHGRWILKAVNYCRTWCLKLLGLWNNKISLYVIHMMVNLLLLNRWFIVFSSRDTISASFQWGESKFWHVRNLVKFLFIKGSRISSSWQNWNRKIE